MFIQIGFYIKNNRTIIHNNKLNVHANYIKFKTRMITSTKVELNKLDIQMTINKYKLVIKISIANTISWKIIIGYIFVNVHLLNFIFMYIVILVFI